MAPFDGIVTRRNIEEGENVVVGTMNNAGTQLLTVADMSIIEAEVEVDETEIPSVKIGQPAKVTIDAIAGETFPGKVTEIGNSPMQTAAQAAGRTAGHELQGGGHARQGAGGRPSRVHVLGGDHDRHAHAGRRRADPGDGRARAGVRQGRQDRARRRRTTRRSASSSPEPHGVGRRARAGPDAQGGRGRVPDARTASRRSCRSRPASPATSTSRCSQG